MPVRAAQTSFISRGSTHPALRTPPRARAQVIPAIQTTPRAGTARVDDSRADVEEGHERQRRAQRPERDRDRLGGAAAERAEAYAALLVFEPGERAVDRRLGAVAGPVADRLGGFLDERPQCGGRVFPFFDARQ